MTNNDRTIRHGEMMLALGRAFGAIDARSAVLSALWTSTHRVLTEDEVNAVIAEMDAVIKRGMDEHTEIWNERVDALS